MRSPALVAGKLLAFAIFATGTADAAEIRVFASNALKTTLQFSPPEATVLREPARQLFHAAMQDVAHERVPPPLPRR
jgi:hypothetical protein